MIFTQGDRVKYSSEGLFGLEGYDEWARNRRGTVVVPVPLGVVWDDKPWNVSNHRDYEIELAEPITTTEIPASGMETSEQRENSELRRLAIAWRDARAAYIFAKVPDKVGPGLMESGAALAAYLDEKSPLTVKENGQ